MKRLAFPEIKHENHENERGGVEEKNCSRAFPDAYKESHRQAAQRRPERAGQIVAGAIERDRFRQLRSRDKLRDDRLPGRIIHCRADTQQQRQ